MMEAVQFSQRRWLRATLVALAVVLALVDRSRTFTNNTSRVSRYPAIAAVSGADVLKQPRNLEGDDDADLDEEVQPYSDWEEAEQEVSSLIEQAEGLHDRVRSSERAKEKLDRLEDEKQPVDREAEQEDSSLHEQTAGLRDRVRSSQTVKQKLDRLEGEEQPVDRENMVAVIHHTLGRGSSRLDTRAMKQFAEMSGFEGQDAEWVAEYEYLCAEYDCLPRTGLALEDLQLLVSDTSDEGTYYSDEELESICNELGVDPRLRVPRRRKRDDYRPHQYYKPKFKKKRSARRDPWA